MNHFRLNVLLCFVFPALLLMPGAKAFAKLNVLTTTTTLADLVKTIGGPEVKVQSFSRGTQDPHYLEARPSYMLQARNADLVISVGLELEQAWLPNVLRGSRSPKLLTEKGHLILGQHTQALDVPEGRIDRSHGDVHPSGNPHFYLDPVRVVEVLDFIAARLSSLDSKNAEGYKTRAEDLKAEIQKKVPEWQEQLKATGVRQVITYHKTLRYFLDRFGIELFDTIEPNPGIPPSPRHIISLVSKAKEQNVNCILTENFFETNAARRVSSEVEGHFEVIATEVGGNKKASSYINLIDHIVEAVKSCGNLQSKEKS